MNVSKIIQTGSIAAALMFALLTDSFAPAARANVYATNIKLNGGMNSITNAASGTPVTISFILNEPATMGTTVNILSGTNVVRSLSFSSGNAGALRGTNIVVWDGNGTGGSSLAAGTYSIGITPAASGFTNWVQTSLDVKPGNYVYSPQGIAVNNNSNSPYYGRVFVGNAAKGPSGGSANPVPGDLDGILKANADGSLADEGQGNTNGTQAGYFWNDDGYNDSPHFLRYGQDDRIYALDLTNAGKIVACNMIMSTNQVVLSPANYSHNPFGNTVTNGGGWAMFDVTDAGTANGRLWLGDYDSFGGAGIWIWHMVNGVANPSDTTGTQAVAAGGDLSVWPAGGFMMDESSNIFVSQDPLSTGDTHKLAMVFTNWNGVTTLTNGTGWRVGGGDTTFSGIFDTALNSRTNPKYVAYSLSAGTGGIRVLYATNGAVVSNGTMVLTNLDAGHYYFGVAWDAVGNLYGASASINRWRVFSPPGTNQSTTLATETVQIGSSGSGTVYITSIVTSSNTVIINFTGPASAAPSAFTLLRATTAGGPYSSDLSATIIQLSPGVFQATTTKSGANQFYRVKLTQSVGTPTRPTITSLGVTNSTVTINFTGASSDPASAFTLLSAGSAPGPYASIISATIIQIRPGVFQASANKNGSIQFYRLKR